MSTMEEKKTKKIPARQYDLEFKQNAVKLAEKLGVTEAARGLGIPDNTLYGWVRKHRNGELIFPGAEEREVNEILEKATRFFAVSRRR